jgi:hypothetical protein
LEVSIGASEFLPTGAAMVFQSITKKLHKPMMAFTLRGVALAGLKEAGSGV